MALYTKVPVTVNSGEGKNNKSIREERFLAGGRKAFLFPLSGSFPKKIGWRNLTFCINRTRIRIENIAFCKKC